MEFLIMWSHFSVSFHYLFILTQLSFDFYRSFVWRPFLRQKDEKNMVNGILKWEISILKNLPAKQKHFDMQCFWRALHNTSRLRNPIPVIWIDVFLLNIHLRKSIHKSRTKRRRKLRFCQSSGKFKPKKMLLILR